MGSLKNAMAEAGQYRAEADMETRIVIRNLVEALETHIADESSEKGIPAATLCPCTEEVLAEARAFLNPPILIPDTRKTT